MPEVDKDIAERLTGIREGLRLKWNPRGALEKPGYYHADGSFDDPEWEPRWELWDTDPDGADYMVMRLQTPDGEFKPPGEWLIHHLQRLNPEHYGGDLERMYRELVEEPELLREVGTRKDSDDLIEAIGKWAEWAAKPKAMVAKAMGGDGLFVG